MTAAMTLAQPDDQGASPFAGADVCRLAGLRLLPGRRGPAFGDDAWDFTAVDGLPAQMQPSYRPWDFTAITTPAWRLVAKEQLMALLAPRHEAVAVLARASRTPMHLRTCQLRFAELVRLLNWLHGQQVLTLGQLTTGHCQAYLVHRRGRECRAVTQIYPAHAAPSGPAEPGRGMKPARGTRRHGTSFSTGGTPAMTSTSEPQDPGQHAQADSPGDIPAERPAWLDRLDVLTGQWEMEASFEAGYFGDGREWKHDFGLTYLKVD